jgi:hypothetical protein
MFMMLSVLLTFSTAAEKLPNIILTVRSLNLPDIEHPDLPK